MAQGIRVSPGVYRNPTTGALFQSTNGVIPGSMIPKAGNTATNTVQSNPTASNQTSATIGATNTLNNQIPKVSSSTVNTGVSTPTTPATGTSSTAVVNPNGWNENLSNEAKRLREIQAAQGLNAKQKARLAELMALKAGKNAPAPTAPAPAPTEAAPTGTAAGSPAGTASPAPGLDPEMLRKLSEKLFPGNAPLDADRIGKDLLYQDALKRGEQVLNRRAAARGLLGSGAEIEGFNDFQSSLGAKTAERISQVDQQEAERLAKIQLEESLRQERANNEQWSRNLSLAELMQQQDPTNAIMTALASSGNLTVEQAKTLASFLAQNYDTVRANVSAGGGGGTPFTPVTPVAANTLSTVPTNIASNTSSSAGWMDTVSGLLSSLLK